MSEEQEAKGEDVYAYKEKLEKKKKIATILLAACLLLGNVSVANAASIDNGNKVHFNTEDNDTDLTLLQSKIATEEVTCDFTDATNDGASAYADTRRVSNKYMWSASTMEYNFSDQKWTSNTEIFSTYAKTSEGFVMSGFLLNPKGQSNYNSALREHSCLTAVSRWQKNLARTTVMNQIRNYTRFSQNIIRLTIRVFSMLTHQR